MSFGAQILVFQNNVRPAFETHFREFSAGGNGPEPGDLQPIVNVSRHAAAPLLPPSQESVEAIFPKGKVVPYVSLFWSPANLDPPLLT